MNPSIALRRLAINSTRARFFHTTRATMVKVGDSLPNVELVENSPGNKVNLKDVIKNKAILIGVPAAFSPSCSNSHVPGYIQHPKLKSAGEVFVIAVNDPFVTKAWQEQLDPGAASGIRFLADPSAEFTKALETDFDATPILGNVRSKRYAIVVEDGKVKEVHIEPDNTGVSVSAADKVIQ